MGAVWSLRVVGLRKLRLSESDFLWKFPMDLGILPLLA